MAEQQRTVSDISHSYRNKLKEHRVALVEQLNVLDGLYDYLIQYNVATGRIINRIKKQGETREGQAGALLDYLETRPEEDLKKFVKALKQDHQDHLAKLFESASKKRKRKDGEGTTAPHVKSAKGHMQREENEKVSNVSGSVQIESDMDSSHYMAETPERFKPWPQSRAAYDMGPITVCIEEQLLQEELEEVVTLASAIASSKVKGYIKLLNFNCQNINVTTFDKWKNEVLLMLKQLVGDNCKELFTFSRNATNEDTFYLHVLPASTQLLVPPFFSKLLTGKVVIPETKEELIEEMIKICQHYKCFVLNEAGKPVQLRHAEFKKRMKELQRLMAVKKMPGFPAEEMKKYTRIEMPNADYAVFTMYGPDHMIKVKTGLQIWPEKYEELLGLATHPNRDTVQKVIVALQQQLKETNGILYISSYIKNDVDKMSWGRYKDLTCDILVITSTDMPLLLSVSFEDTNLSCEYAKSVLPYLDESLSCAQSCESTCAFYVKHRVITSKTLKNDNWYQELRKEVKEDRMYPDSYLAIGEAKYKSMTYSLYTSLASFFPSTFGKDVDTKSMDYMKTMNLLTPEQLTTLQKCQADTAKVILLKALAGTGKTVIAVEYVKWIRGLGFDMDDILYVTYSKVLAEQIREIKLPWCHKVAGKPLCKVTTIRDMLMWTELPAEYKKVKWWILDDVQNYACVEKKVDPKRNQERDSPQDIDRPIPSTSEDTISHKKTNDSMTTMSYGSVDVRTLNTQATKEDLQSTTSYTVKTEKQTNIFKGLAPPSHWLAHLKSLTSEANIHKVLMLCDPTQSLGKGEEELKLIQKVMAIDTQAKLTQISRNSIEISNFIINKLIPRTVLKDNEYDIQNVGDIVAHQYKGEKPDTNINCSYDFDTLKDMIDREQNNLHDRIMEGDLGIIIDRSAVKEDTKTSDPVGPTTGKAWGVLDDYIGIEKPYIIAVLGCHAHWSQKVAIASRARVHLHWTELQEQVSAAELSQLFGSRNDSYVAWVTAGTPAIAVFAGHCYDTNRPLERVVAAPLTPQGLGGEYEEVAAIPPVPHPRSLTAVVTHKSQVWLIGGEDAGNNTLAGCDVLNLVTCQWRSGPPLMTARSQHTVTMVGETMVAVGGWDKHDKTLSSTEVLTTESEWTPGPDLPGKRFDHAACEYEGRLYISGGLDDEHTKLLSVMSWTPGEDRWRQEASLRTGRNAHIMVTTGGGLLVCGGWEDNSMEQYDSQTGTWNRLRTKLPEMKINSSAVVYGPQLYVVGGQDYEFSLSPSSSTLRFDIDWHRDQDLPWRMLDTEACLIELPNKPHTTT